MIELILSHAKFKDVPYKPEGDDTEAIDQICWRRAKKRIGEFPKRGIMPGERQAATARRRNTAKHRTVHVDQEPHASAAQQSIAEQMPRPA